MDGDPNAGLDADAIVARVRASEDADGRLPVPDVSTWDIFPWEGELLVKRLDDPADERPRHGEDGPASCGECARPDTDDLWSDANWRVHAPAEAGSVPSVIIEPRDHLDLGDLSDELAAGLGVLLLHTERALAATPGVGRVHVNKWGDGGAHLHVFLFGRPARLLQLRGSCLPDWMDIIPAMPRDEWDAIHAGIGERLTARRAG